MLLLLLGGFVEACKPLLQDLNLGNEQVVGCLDEAKGFVRLGQGGKELEVPQAQIV